MHWAVVPSDPTVVTRTLSYRECFLPDSLKPIALFVKFRNGCVPNFFPQVSTCHLPSSATTRWDHQHQPYDRTNCPHPALVLKRYYKPETIRKSAENSKSVKSFFSVYPSPPPKMSRVPSTISQVLLGIHTFYQFFFQSLPQRGSCLHPNKQKRLPTLRKRKNIWKVKAFFLDLIINCLTYFYVIFTPNST